MNTFRPVGIRRLLVAAAVAAVTLVMPAVVAAHSELETASPPDGATLTTPPTEIVLTFSAELDPAKSSISLRDPAGTEIAKAGVDTADDTVMRIPLDTVTLDPGAYEIRWTSTSTDGDILRGTLHFEVLEPTPAPTAAPTPSPSATAAATPSASPTAAPSPTPSAATSGGTTTGSTADVLIPIFAALVVIGLLGWWLVRNRSRGGTRG